MVLCIILMGLCVVTIFGLLLYAKLRKRKAENNPVTVPESQPDILPGTPATDEVPTTEEPTTDSQQPTVSRQQKSPNLSRHPNLSPTLSPSLTRN